MFSLVSLLLVPKKFSEAKVMFIIMLMIIMKSHFQEIYYESNVFFSDSISTSMSCLSLLITCSTMMVYGYVSSSQKLILCLLSGTTAFILFVTNNLIVFFVLFELSLIPLSMMILGWGKQPERIMASKYMITYTFFSSFPFLCFMVFMEETHSFTSMNNPLIVSDYSLFNTISSKLSLLTSVSILLVFLMKTPIYFLHSWLPKAHVEAPLEGSMILAGIMLKVGTYGMIRMLMMFPSNFMTTVVTMIFFISFVGSMYSVILAISSDDLKMSIALSSVSHMNFMVCGLCSMKELSVKSSSSMMISHGFSSSILFFLVTIVYEMNNSRSFSISKSSLGNFPSMSLFSMIFFSLSIGIPPSLPFLSEMMIVSCSWSFWTEMFSLVWLYIIVNSFYSMMLFGMIFHSAKNKTLKPHKSMFLFNFLSFIFFFFMFSIFFFPESIF